MDLATAVQFLGLIASSFVVAVSTLFLMGLVDRKSGKSDVRAVSVLDHSDEDVAFLFDDEVLVNATDRANSIIGKGENGLTDWARLTSILHPHFPNLTTEISMLAEKGTIELAAESGNAKLCGRWQNGLARIALFNFGETSSDVLMDLPSYDAIHRELETLRSTAANAPFLVWRQGPDGSISWANASYLALAKSNTDFQSWPPRRLFEVCKTLPARSASSSQRISTSIPGEIDPRWFECFETSLGEDSLFTAVAADKVVRAETALNEFVQTLTKTFAHLTIGLAIFDKQRKLALFNPALMDLTSLKPDFLSGQPTLKTVLDQLRENRMLPEPKDYKSWRRQVYELEVAAENGTFEETWSLANGRTYRVTGRPHPDGALAFLMEDISAEISLTRQFRTDMEIGQGILDSMPEAIAVFSATGALLHSNSAYVQLWGGPQNSILEDTNIISASKAWAVSCTASPVWGDAREFVGSPHERAEWHADVQMIGGRKISCRFTPISGGATLAGFSVAQTSDQISNVSTSLENHPAIA